MSITLDELLASRDARHAMQLRLLTEHPGKTLVCLTVVMPGSVKRNDLSLRVAHAAIDAMRSAFAASSPITLDNECFDTNGCPHIIERDLVTGYEAYLLTPLDILKAKRIAVDIEDAHPLGRLFDIDIIDSNGIPVGRDRVGGRPRTCLVCGHEARYCMRMRWHTSQQIMEAVENLVDNFNSISH